MQAPKETILKCSIVNNIVQKMCQTDDDTYSGLPDSGMLELFQSGI